LKHITYILVLLVVFLLVACSPADTPVPATETASPQPPTSTPLPTDTPTATPTPVPTDTPTATPTLTPTPDLRVIDAVLEDLALQSNELPEAGQFIVEGHRGLLSNNAIVAYIAQELGAETAELARAYVEESNRTTGYGVAFLRTNPAYTSPLRVYHEIAVFENAEGAKNDITIFKPQLMLAFGRSPIEDHSIIGDATNVYTEVVTEYGQELLVYLIEFSYRNTAHEVAFWGLDGEYTLDDCFAIAEILLEKLEQAPLASMVE